MLCLGGASPPVDGRLRDIQVGSRLSQRKDGAGDPRVVCSDLCLLFPGDADGVLRGSAEIVSPAIVAASAALASMAAHALVDFTFYVPICLLMYGAGMGFLDTRLSSAGADHTQPSLPKGRLRRGAFAALATLAAWALATPVAAQAAAGYAHRQWQAARGESAAYWFEVARRVEPRDWRYHWYAGQFWYAQAQANRKPEAAPVKSPLSSWAISPPCR